MTEAMLHGTNLTVAEFASMVDNLPRAFTEMRLDWRMYDDDVDLLEEHMSQLEWLLKRFDDVLASDLRGHTWWLLRAAVRAVVPFLLFQFAIRFPRIAVATGLMR